MCIEVGVNRLNLKIQTLHWVKITGIENSRLTQTIMAQQVRISRPWKKLVDL